MKLSFLILMQVVFITACSTLTTSDNQTGTSSQASSSEESKSKPQTSTPAPKVAKPPENLNLKQLDSVATALRAIYDRSLMNPSPRVPPVLACDISGEEALNMMMPLKARMDEKIPRELKDYILTPKKYAKANEFSQCAKTCHCGLYASLLSDAVVEATEEGWHKKQLKTLRKKASAQTAEQTLSCAKKQNWFCESQLRQSLSEEY